MELQKASLWKRIAAWLLDTILVATLAVGIAALLAGVLKYDTYCDKWVSSQKFYEEKYGVKFQTSEEEYNAMTEEEKAAYNKNYADAQTELYADYHAMYAFNMVVNLSLVMMILSLMISVMTSEFVVPLILKNGQTIGKKVFGIGLVRPDGVKISNIQLFVRALLGKYAVETMIPGFYAVLFFLGALDYTGLIVLGILLLAEILCIAFTKNHCPIHDMLASTVTVDLASQRVFNNPEELIEYTKRIHAEKANRQDY